MQSSFAQQQKVCYCCGSKVHIAPQCPEKDKPGQEWWDHKQICKLLAATQISTEQEGQNKEHETNEENERQQDQNNDGTWVSRSFQGFQYKSCFNLKTEDRILLDSGSMLPIFRDAHHVSNIEETTKPMEMFTNGGTCIVNQKAQLDCYRTDWYSNDAIENILGLSGLKETHWIV